VVNRIFVSFAQDLSSQFGKDANGKVTGQFMDRHTVSGVRVNIQDFEGNPIQNVTDVKLSYTYQNNSTQYGGYTSSFLTNAVADFVIDLRDDGSGTRFAQDEEKVLQYAGSYVTNFSFRVSGMEISYAGENLPVNTPQFAVYSVAPAVKITEAYYGSASSETAGTFTDTAVTVYAYEYETKSVVCGTTFKYKAYKQPYVTLNLTGYGNAESAVVTFVESGNGKVLLYQTEEGQSEMNTYSWTKDGSCKRWVGYWNSQTGDDDRTKAGTLNAEYLILTYQGQQYQVPAHITIDNPN
jgi:hypothetical protein